MGIQIALQSLENLEQTMADLYGWFAVLFGDDPEAVRLFTALKDVELGHRDLLRYERRMVFQNPQEFKEVDFDTVEIQRLADSVRDVMKAKPPTLPEALEMAIVMEESAAEDHQRSSLEAANPSMAELLRNLETEDRGHLQGLRAFAATLPGACRQP